MLKICILEHGDMKKVMFCGASWGKAAMLMFDG
jgi:hypothetical protein